MRKPKAPHVEVHSNIVRPCPDCGQEVATHLVEYVKRIAGGHGSIEGCSRKLLPHECKKAKAG
jgi:hypothetical protein